MYEQEREEERQPRYFEKPLPEDDLEDDADFEDEADELAWAEAYDPQERRERLADRVRLAAGVGDLLGVVSGTIAVLALLALILTLVQWVRQDLLQTAEFLGTGL
ncbi:MAG: hypothetical protein IKP40_08150 [Clostridia bacterium]|nr:hypothetical protein [Clostridia bacterium]